MDRLAEAHPRLLVAVLVFVFLGVPLVAVGLAVFFLPKWAQFLVTVASSFYVWVVGRAWRFW